MPLVVAIHSASSIPLEVDSVRLEDARELSADAVARTLIQRGNRQVELGEFFHVSGSASDNTMVWEGDCSRVKLIGTGLSDGSIRVTGNAGMHLGAEMTGGEIIAEQNTADWVGAEMHGVNDEVNLQVPAGRMRDCISAWLRRRCSRRY